MVDMVRLYPDRDVDIVALASTRRSSGAGAINYGAIGGYFAKMVAGGLQSAMIKGRKGFDKIIDFVIEHTEVDREFLDTLGRQNTPYWGADEWNETIVPEGYVDRFDAAADTTVVVLGFLIARFVLGRVSIGSIASFAGGQYGKFKSRKASRALLESVEGIADDLDDPSLRSRMSKLQDSRLDGSFDVSLAIAKAFASNNRSALSSIIRDMDAREEASQLDF